MTVERGAHTKSADPPGTTTPKEFGNATSSSCSRVGHGTCRNLALSALLSLCVDHGQERSATDECRTNGWGRSRFDPGWNVPRVHYHSFVFTDDLVPKKPRELVRLGEKRKNITPILGAATKVFEFKH